MRPRQRLRSTASQATVSSSVLLETPSFVASSGSSRRNASEQLASQLPRTPDDEIALSDTSRRASAASFTAYTDQSQSEPEQPQSPGKRKREGSIGRSTLLGSSPSKRRSWMPGTQADATFHPLTSQGESFAEDTPSEHSGGITSGVPPPEPEPVARLRSEENSRSVTKKRSWFGRPREESQENISSQLETGEPTPAPSLPSLQSTQNTEPNNAPRNADRQVPKVAIEEETSPQGWLTWLGLSRAHTDIIQEDPQSPTTTLPSVPETLPAAVPTSSLNPNSSANAQPEPSHVAEQMSPKPSSSWFSWTRWQNAQPTEALDQPTVPHVEPNHGEPTSEEPSKAVPHQSKLTPVDSRTPGWFGSWKRVAPQVEPTSLPQSDNSIEPSHLEPHPIEAEQPRNPIVDKVPPSTWASYFSSRYASPQRRVGEAHPENMEVDFPAELSTPESKSTTSQQTKQPRPGSSSLKPTPSATAKRIGRSGSQSSFFGGGNSKPPSIKSEDGPEPPQSRPSKPLTHTSPTPPPIASTSASVKNDRQTTKIKTPPMPHLVLPSFEDTFDYLPRSAAPASKSLAASAARKVGSAIWGENPVHKSLRKAKDKVPHMDRLPRKLAVLGAPPHARLRHTKKVVILTTHVCRLHKVFVRLLELSWIIGLVCW